ncbi:MAG: hypothetical protein EBY09_15130 [Verrucomicrobia bacterium]|nr:hypothetical protein [Verrucomicrobiota bacterium]
MQLLNTILIGITAGSIYSLMAIAFVLVWRSTRVINFAQAGMALLSTYFGYEAVTRIGSFWLALPIAMLGGASGEERTKQCNVSGRTLFFCYV